MTRADYDILGCTKSKAIRAFDPEEQKTCINLGAKTGELKKKGVRGVGWGVEGRGRESVRSLKKSKVKSFLLRIYEQCELILPRKPPHKVNIFRRQVLETPRSVKG